MVMTEMLTVSPSVIKQKKIYEAETNRKNCTRFKYPADEQ